MNLTLFFSLLVLLFKCGDNFKILQERHLHARMKTILAPCPQSHLLPVQYIYDSHYVDKHGDFILNYTTKVTKDIPSKRIKVSVSYKKRIISSIGSILVKARHDEMPKNRISGHLPEVRCV